MRARQHAGANRNRTYRARVATINARLAFENLRTHDFGFEVKQDIAEFSRIRRIGISRQRRRHRGRACESLGAERGINYRSEDFAEVVKAATGGKGADVILDMVAGDYVAREIDCLADDGRLVVIALLGGATGKIDFGHIMRRRLTITGSTLRPRPVAFKQMVADKLRQRIWPLIESGQIKPVIFQTFPFDQAAQAHALMETSTHVGKIMLTVA